MNKVFYFGITFISIFAVFVEPAKILSIFNIPSKSHYLYGVGLLKELAARGHEVTSVNLYPQKSPLKNFRDVFIKDNLYISEQFISEAHGGQDEDPAESIYKVQIICINKVINIMKNPEFQNILKTEKFDLIILEVLWNEALMGLGEHFNAPVIGMSTFGVDVGIEDMIGNTSPNSVVPNLHYPYTAEMTFLQRVHNFIGNTRAYLMFWKGLAGQKDLYEKYFPNAKLSFDEARRNLSLLIVNQHPSLLYPRPNMQNVIEAIGLHIPRSIDSLPSSLQTFLDNSPEGVVYISMGTNIQSKNLPVEKREMFLNVFRKLKQKVLWKFEDPNVPNKPDNVHIITWAPQQAILNHTNVKVFITHGGMLSTTEAVHFAKPMLGIPFFWDQQRNLINAQKKGICITFYYPTLTEKQMDSALHDLLYNPKYTENVKQVSRQYHDQPLLPMDNALYWVEYVLRHNGAYHLRNPGVDLNILQYYSVDVIGFLLTILLVAIGIVTFTVKSLLGQKNLVNTKSSKRTKHKTT